MSTVWGLIDDRAGHSSQVLGVVAKLGLPYTMKRLDYNGLACFPNALLGASLTTLSSTSAPLAAPFPKLVIAAGRRTIPALRWIKKQSPSTKTIYLMWPDVTQDIDLIVVPEHDKKGERPNVITTLAPLHAVTQETLTAARSAWESQFAHLPKPWIALVIGGSTKQGHYNPRDWRELITRSLNLAGHGSLLITTSRRTPKEAVDMFVPLLQSPHLLHRWSSDKDNPYLGILACADGVVVTGDSLSMCTEVCMSDKPVFIFARDSVAPAKHRRMHQTLYERGMARPLDNQAALDWKPFSTLDDVSGVVAEIKTRFADVFEGA